jgi:hypothetical protein
MFALGKSNRSSDAFETYIVSGMEGERNREGGIEKENREKLSERRRKRNGIER